MRHRVRLGAADAMRGQPRDTRRARTHAANYTGRWGVEQRQLSRARLSGAAQERRRVARDLHDGVQNELVSLILGLSLAEEDPSTPPELAASLSVLRARAQSTLSGIREIAHGIRSPLLAAAGVVEALRVQAALARIPVNLVGAAPRSSDNAEEAVYFACLEALQNVAKHAPRSASVTLRLRYREGRLVVRIEDDGGGFVQIRGREGAGLTNIRDRVASVGGKARISSTPGRGTVVAVALPWPAKPAAPTPVRPQSVIAYRTSS
jgi:signal transduction histidine kinase